MPQAPRGKGRGAGGRGDDEFVLYLQGIPAHCRWQELKDFVRQSALHIRQAVVYDDQHGYPTGMGQIIVKNEDEAWRTYQRLSTSGWEGQSLTVTLARASSPTRPIAGPTRSPTSIAQPSYLRSRGTTTSTTASASPISSESMAIPTTPYHSPEPITIVNFTGVANSNVMSVPMDAILQPVSWNTATAKGIPFPTPHVAAAPFLPSPFEPFTFSFYPYQMPAVQPMYEIHVHKPPVHNSSRTNMYHRYYYSNGYGVQDNHMAANTRFGTHIAYGDRTVLVSNLGPDVNPQTLAGHFCAAGVMEGCDIIPEHDVGKASGRKQPSFYAMVIFATEEGAKQATDLCDRSLLMGRMIRVRPNGNAAESPTSISNPTSSVERSGGSDIFEANRFTPTTTSTPSPSSPQPLKTWTADVDASTNTNQDQNHRESRRDSGKELCIHRKPDALDNPDKATAAPPPREPLVVNGSGMRERSFSDRRS